MFTNNILMCFLLFSTLAYLSICHSSVTQDASGDCSSLNYLNSRPDVSVEIKKHGFHRELDTVVHQFNPSGLWSGVLLLYSWPKDIFVDPFQLASLSNQSNWEILLDSAIDLEVPAHKSSGFISYLYPNLKESAPGLLHITIPIHGRYQKPSFKKAFNSVDIYPPELLLRVEKCTQLNSLEPYTIVDAPCTADNPSICQWVKVHHQQHGHVTLQFPVGDRSLVIPVCCGTLLVTMICCVALSFI